MEKKSLTISSLIGVGTLVGMIVAGYNVFQTDEEAVAAQTSNDAQHVRMASDNERGRLENELKLVNLEIDFFLHRIEQDETLDAKSQDRLDYLRLVRSNLEERLRDLASVKATG